MVDVGSINTGSPAETHEDGGNLIQKIRRVIGLHVPLPTLCPPSTVFMNTGSSSKLWCATSAVSHVLRDTKSVRSGTYTESQGPL